MRLDQIHSFIKECCYFDNDKRIRSLILYNAYRFWCVKQDSYWVSYRTFSLSLIELGLCKVRKKTDNFWVGIALNKSLTAVEP